MTRSRLELHRNSKVCLQKKKAEMGSHLRLDEQAVCLSFFFLIKAKRPIKHTKPTKTALQILKSTKDTVIAVWSQFCQP